jgi:hypothetical protein
MIAITTSSSISVNPRLFMTVPLPNAVRAAPPVGQAYASVYYRRASLQAPGAVPNGAAALAGGWHPGGSFPAEQRDGGGGEGGPEPGQDSALGQDGEPGLAEGHDILKPLKRPV